MSVRRVLAVVALLAGCGQSLDVGDDLPPPSGVPVLGFDSMTSSYDETEGALEVTVYLSERSNEIVTFWFDFGGTATNGSDYHGIGGAGILLPGVDFFTVPVTLLDDGIAEPAETIEMSVSKCVNCQLGLATHTLTIRDNTLPRVTFDQPTSGAMESTPGTVALNILPASPVAITVDYVVSGTASASDYGLRDGTLTIPAGATTASISIEHIDDSLDEDPEMVVVTLSNPSNAIIGLYATNTHTISDDDDEVTAAFFGPNDTVTEGDSGMQILTAEVRLDAVSGRTVSVPFGPDPSQFFSATLGVDYAIMTPSPLVFPPGTTSQTITFAILGDTIQDGSDTVGIELHSASAAFIGYPYVHSARIDNDECYATGAYRVCPDSAPTTDLTIDTTTFQNTSFDNSPVCASRQPPGWLEAGQPSSCFVVANNITIGTARFEGFRPVVLVALDSITINTLLDAGSRFSGSTSTSISSFRSSTTNGRSATNSSPIPDPRLVQNYAVSGDRRQRRAAMAVVMVPPLRAPLRRPLRRHPHFCAVDVMETRSGTIKAVMEAARSMSSPATRSRSRPMRRSMPREQGATKVGTASAATAAVVAA